MQRSTLIGARVLGSKIKIIRAIGRWNRDYNGRVETTSQRFRYLPGGEILAVNPYIAPQVKVDSRATSKPRINPLVAEPKPSGQSATIDERLYVEPRFLREQKAKSAKAKLALEKSRKAGKAGKIEQTPAITYRRYSNVDRVKELRAIYDYDESRTNGN